MTGTTALCIISLASIVSFMAGVWWATARNEVLQRKAHGEPRDAGDIGPAGFPYWGGDR